MSTLRCVLLGCALALFATTLAWTEEKVSDEHIVLRTAAGDIVLNLYPEVAPEHVKQLLKLTKMGVYDGTYFHRVDPSLVIQLANAESRRMPLSNEQKAAIHPLKAEFSKLKHKRGTLSMAREDADPDSGATSYSILVVDAPHLDGKYTIFGHIDEPSLAVVAEILKVKCEGTQPVFPIDVHQAMVVTTQELAQMPRRPAISISGPIEVSVKYLAFPKTPALLIGLMLALSLINYLLGKRELDRATTFLGAGHISIGIAVLSLTFWPVIGGDYELDPESYWWDFPAARAVSCGVVLLLLIGISSLVMRNRLTLRTRSSLNMINILIGTFLLFTLVAPLADQEKILAVGVFVVLLSMFKLMSSFESTT